MINNIEIAYSTNTVKYIDSIKKMEERVFHIYQKKEKELIWFLSHDNIYTVGTSGNNNEIINKTSVPIIKTNRGGKTTYHGPGQRIIYLMIDLQKRRKDIRKFVNLLESSAINLLKEFDIDAKTFPDRVGIWVIKNKNIKFDKEQKIGAIGLRVKKWITYHGLSFNINTNLDYYKNINPCGLTNYKTTSLEALGIKLSEKNFDKIYLKFFLKGLKIL